jgi:hypothetical protein
LFLIVRSQHAHIWLSITLFFIRHLSNF